MKLTNKMAGSLVSGVAALAMTSCVGTQKVPDPHNAKDQFLSQKSTAITEPIQPMLTDGVMPPQADLRGWLEIPGARCRSEDAATLVARAAENYISLCKAADGHLYALAVGPQIGAYPLDLPNPVVIDGSYRFENANMKYNLSRQILTVVTELSPTQGKVSSATVNAYWSAWI